MHDAHAIAWQRQDLPGVEYAKLVTVDSEWYLTGTVVTVEDEVPCELRYRIVIDANWRTVSADILGSLGLNPVSIQIANDGALGWVMNGRLCAGLDGCVDIDLAFTPATNTLPIRRLGLQIGGSGAVGAAWLRFPEMSLERLDQTYTRTRESTYKYESSGGAFTRELTVNEAGLVLDYPGLWQSIAQRSD